MRDKRWKSNIENVVNKKLWMVIHYNKTYHNQLFYFLRIKYGWMKSLRQEIKIRNNTYFNCQKIVSSNLQRSDDTSIRKSNVSVKYKVIQHIQWNGISRLYI